MSSPLADRLRPKTLDEMAGQRSLIGEGCALRRIIESGNIPNLIFYGASGTGKTTLASIIARRTNKKLHKLNCTSASTADLKSVFSEIDTIAAPNGILLYLDEIQYFNKKQQQSLLEYTENGSITLIAATTENPYFYVYGALLSRCTVFEFKPVNEHDILPVLNRGIKLMEKELGTDVSVTEPQLLSIASSGSGDVRKALGTLELCILSGDKTDGKITITDECVSQVSGRPMRYDRTGDEHYDCISAFQKSMRGSDPDAAVHYLARILEGGDLPSACRRLMVCACEDVGLAYPQIIPIVKSAVDAALMLGMPEARIPLADAAILVAISPKSNSAYSAVNAAGEDIRAGKAGDIPRILQNKHLDSDEVENKGQHYLYPHNFPDHYVYQQYLPDSIKDKIYYRPGDNKNESAFADRLKAIKAKYGDKK